MIKTFDYQNTPNVKVVNDILIDSVKMKTREIHIIPVDEGLRINFKINNKMIHYTTIEDMPRSYDHAPNLIIRIKIMANLSIVETNKKQEGKINANIDNVDINQKVIIQPTDKGEEILIINE